MRKLGILAVAALLLVALAAPSFAAETTFTGSYRIRSVMDYNWDKNANGDDLNTSYFDQRFRLNITHKRSEFLKAVVSIDLVEDRWGQQRNFRSNGVGGGENGYINSAYIEAITKIGLFKAGLDTQGGRFGHGTWSDSGKNAGVKGNPGVTWGIKVDNFIATLSYIKYVDLVDTVFANRGGLNPLTFRVWPGRIPEDVFGGDGSAWRNSDTNTYVMTAHYVTDSIKAGFLFQYIREPSGIAATRLVYGIADMGFFGGEAGFIPYYMGTDGVNATSWPAPAGAPATGYGRAGMYRSNLYIAAIYADLKFLDGKLNLKAEYDRIWGTSKISGLGNAYNNYLDTFGLVPYDVGPGSYWVAGTNIPGDLKVDGHNVYVDLSYDFDVAKVGVAFLFGSGEKHWRAFTQHHYNLNTTGNDDFRWGTVIVPGGGNFSGDVDDYPLGLGSSQENVTSVKLYWGVDPTEKLDIHGAFIWAKYTQPVGRFANGYYGPGQAFYGHPMSYANPKGAGYVPAGVSDELGWEIDAGATYEIMEGLSLNSEFGVLFTGDAFDYMQGGVRHDWGPIYRWVNTLTYEF